VTSGEFVRFVCVENSCRSLMAEAMFTGIAPEGWTAIPARTEPPATANPRTGPKLREAGLDVWS
jgi:protein-tyrosine-phosphatase